MSHWHDSRSASQNVGNHLGSRSCVRQSRLYREYESGNATKALLGQDNLIWETKKKQGAYSGHSVYDHTVDRYSHVSEKDRNAIEKKRLEMESKGHYFGERKGYNSSKTQTKDNNKSFGYSSKDHQSFSHKQNQFAQYGNKKTSYQDSYGNNGQKQGTLPSTREGKKAFSYNHFPSTSHADEYSTSRDAYKKNRMRDSGSSLGLIG